MEGSENLERRVEVDDVWLIIMYERNIQSFNIHTNALGNLSYSQNARLPLVLSFQSKYSPSRNLAISEDSEDLKYKAEIATQSKSTKFDTTSQHKRNASSTHRSTRYNKRDKKIHPSNTTLSSTHFYPTY